MALLPAERPIRILLVEDTETDVLIIRRTLSRSSLDYELTVVRQAEEALELLEADASVFDVLVTDHRLPGMHGLELCREILSQAYPVATVMLTGQGSEDLAVQALRVGVDEYLIKDTRGGYLALFPLVVEEVLRRQRDRQEHRRAESRLRHLAAIVESSHDAIIGCDLQTRIVSWNPAAERMFGFTRDEVLGRDLVILLPDDHGDEMSRMMDRIFGGERIENYETVRRRKDRSTLDVALTVSPIRDQNGVIVGASAIIRDITAQRHAELERRRALHEMETFLFGVTHDLKSPVLSAQGMLGLLREEIEDPSEDVATYMGHLQTSLSWMAQLLEDLAEMSRVGRTDTTPETISLGDIAEEVAGELMPLVTDRRLIIEVQENLPWVFCNRRRLRQTLGNLMGNAVKFTVGIDPSHVEVGILSERKNGKTVFFVADNGPGIPRGEHQRIFEMFYRRHGREVPGTGMGLAVVKKILESMGGSIWVDSQVGQGARFLFTLPLDPEWGSFIEAGAHPAGAESE